nr:metallophosphoesterase [Flavisolibacter sp.]
MKKLLRRLFYKPVLHLSNRYSSKPEKQRIYTALSDLLSRILNEEKEKGLIVPFDADNSKIIIFSDQHKGARNGADDFLKAEQNYLAALDFYYAEGYHFISLGDSEELWENTLHQVKKHQKPAFEKEARFIPKNAFIKIFGNHDLFWDNDPFSFLPLHEIYNADIKVYEGVVLQTSINQLRLNIFCTHGHQGDKVSDGNWFSKFFIARIWAPFQSYLD